MYTIFCRNCLNVLDNGEKPKDEAISFAKEHSLDCSHIVQVEDWAGYAYIVAIFYKGKEYSNK